MRGRAIIDPFAISINLAHLAEEIGIEQAAPVGIIINELVTNALKHAFSEGRAGAIKVKLQKEGTLTLSVADNGIGCANAQREGMGSRLTRLLAQQLTLSAPPGKACP
ncbi:MAG TPA: sensor histidine kinase [Steroidobacter sp.]|uniref:sensor histidine kinase n=1 Tax=Steroidobacter sp. TaxID=1978227 RepID=UPI002ED9090B